MERCVSRNKRFDHESKLTENDNKGNVNRSVCFDWDQVKGDRKATVKIVGLDRPPITESMQFRAGDVALNETLNDTGHYSPDELRDCEGVIGTKPSYVTELQRSIVESQGQLQKATCNCVLSATLDGETQTLKSNTSDLTSSSFESSYPQSKNNPTNLKSAKPLGEERFLSHPIHYTIAGHRKPLIWEAMRPAVPDLETVKGDYSAGSERVMTVFSNIQSTPKSDDTADYRTVSLKTCQKTGDESLDSPNNSNNRTGRPVRVLCRLIDTPSSVVAPVQSENDKIVLARPVHYIRSNAHWSDVTSPTQQRLLSSTSQTLGSALDRAESQTTTPVTSVDYKPKLPGNVLSQSRYGRGKQVTGIRRRNHSKLLEEYKLPERLGTSILSHSDRQPTQQDTVLQDNHVDLYYSNNRNEKISNIDSPLSTGVNENITMKTSQPLFEKQRRWPAEFQKRKAKPYGTIDHFVDIEYYDINSDQELNSLISRRRTRSLNDCEEVNEVVQRTDGTFVSREDACFAELTGRDLLEEDIKDFQAQLKPSPGTMTNRHPKESAKADHRMFFEQSLESNADEKDDHQFSKHGHLLQNKIHRNGYLFETDGNYDIQGDNWVGESSYSFRKNDHQNANNRQCTHIPGRMDHHFTRDGYLKNWRTYPFHRIDYPLQRRSYEIKKDLCDDSSKSPLKTSVLEQYFPRVRTEQTSNAGVMYTDQKRNGSVHEKMNSVSRKDHNMKSNYNDNSIPEIMTYTGNESNGRPNSISLIKTNDRTFTKTLPNANLGCKRDTISVSSSEIDLDLNSLARQGKRRSTCSADSGLVTTDSYDEDSDDVRGENLTGIQSKEEFKRILKQLSRYVLAGYKETARKPEKLVDTWNNNKETTDVWNKNMVGTDINKQRYHLDDEEGELSEVKEQHDNFKRLSMVVNVIIRLRETFTIVLLPKLPNGNRVEEATFQGKLSSLEDHRGNDLLRDAIENRQMDELTTVVSNHSNVDINLRSQSGYSSLHRAAEEGDMESIRILIEHYADLDISDRSGFPPVHHALQNFHYKAAIFLMDCGTDLMSYTSKRIQEFVKVKATAKQYLRQNLKTSL